MITDDPLGSRVLTSNSCLHSFEMLWCDILRDWVIFFNGVQRKEFP